VLYHLGDRGIERRLIPYCAARGIAVVGYSPFGHADFPRESSRGGKILCQVAKAAGRTPRQAVLNFLTRDPDVFTIPKAGDPEHTRENSGSSGWTFTPEQVGMIDRAFPAPARDTPLGML
jgi:diketogulonate reductase-like aldo/keto reductase